MHCASRNPYVALADNLGFVYRRSNPPGRPWVDGDWQDQAYLASRNTFIDKLYRISELRFRSGGSEAIWDFLDSRNEHAQWATYWLGLMHSNDPDQVSVSDQACFEDTHEDWPVVQGYGALISCAGADAPVRLNLAVREIQWNRNGVRLTTDRGTIRADKAIITVSTAVLGSGDILFDPPLPVWKQRAINALPLGNYNNLFFSLESGALEDAVGAITYQRDDTCAYLHVRPFEQDYLFTSTAGRFAWWLERQGPAESEAWLREILQDVFGGKVGRRLVKFKTSAWGYDGFVKGAYSSELPGSRGQRETLARSINNKLFFAGEATSPDQFNTAHGAWLSGQQAVADCQRDAGD